MSGRRRGSVVWCRRQVPQLSAGHDGAAHRRGARGEQQRRAACGAEEPRAQLRPSHRRGRPDDRQDARADFGKRLLPAARTAGYCGSARNSRRLVAVHTPRRPVQGRELMPCQVAAAGARSGGLAGQVAESAVSSYAAGVNSGRSLVHLPWRHHTGIWWSAASLAISRAPVTMREVQTSTQRPVGR